jgi:hypothetical protein
LAPGILKINENLTLMFFKSISPEVLKGWYVVSSEDSNLSED